MIKYVMIFLVSISYAVQAQKIVLSPQEIWRIGQRIYQNECGGKSSNLIVWRDREQNLSLGIGHFIWYPETVSTNNQFDQQFPKLIQFLQDKKVAIPEWLKKMKWCPWHSKKEWQAASLSKQAQELRALMEKTIVEQAEFIVTNFLNYCDQLFFNKSVKRQFNRITVSDAGIYALIDYANFKGFGLDERERYKGQGWGLLQIFLHMATQKQSQNPLYDFVVSAKHVLTLRVENAAPEKKEKQWLPGWYNRLEGYLR